MKVKKINMKPVLSNLLIILSIALIGMGCSGGSANSEKEPEAEAHHEEEEGTVEFTEAQYKASDITLGGIEKRQLSGVFKVNGLLDVPPQNQVSISVPFGGILK